ncbi:MAG: hypothetical protein H0X34_19020 [Chthoniobacterales bacterium]|nr:hypothetical protein [Chthoniobacterales bacterium]
MTTKKKESPAADKESAPTTVTPAVPKKNLSDAEKTVLGSYEYNNTRMQPGYCETDPTTGLRLIHPAANPQQINPIHDDAHEAAATEEAAVLTDKTSTHREKIEATERSNEAEGAPSARAIKAQNLAVVDDAMKRQKVEQKEEERKQSLQAAADKANK